MINKLFKKVDDKYYKRLIENNKRKEGVIVRFDDEIFWKKWISRLEIKQKYNQKE